MDKLDASKIRLAILKVFANRGTELKYPAAFSPSFYEAPETILRWKNFLSAMGRDPIELQEVIHEISLYIKPIIEKSDL